MNEADFLHARICGYAAGREIRSLSFSETRQLLATNWLLCECAGVSEAMAVSAQQQGKVHQLRAESAPLPFPTLIRATEPRKTPIFTKLTATFTCLKFENTVIVIIETAAIVATFTYSFGGKSLDFFITRALGSAAF